MNKWFWILLALSLSLFVILSRCEEVRADEMPPLFLEMYLPYVAGQPLPEFPPCECDPKVPFCVCSGVSR